MKMALIIAALLTTMSVSAVTFDIAAARQEEWDAYIDYRSDYIKTNNLEGYERYLSEYNLQQSFGFKSPRDYAISRDAYMAKYYPPLQGEYYYTDSRGYRSSLDSPSAVQYYGDVQNGRYYGYVSPDRNGIYFDHPHMYTGAYSPQSRYYQPYNSYDYYGSGYYSGDSYWYQGDDIFSELDSYPHYARIASQAGNGYYIVGYY